ncbi:hypothetical protein ACVGOW_28415 [Pseudonocardia saturnea]
MNPRRPLAAAALAAALLSVSTACGGAAAPAAPAGPATPAASADTACTTLLAIDTTPSPDGGPEGPAPVEAVQEWATTLVPLLDGALAAAPPELAPSLSALQPYVRTAATDGTEPDFEDPAFTGAITGYETWAHDNCGYQNVDLVGTDFAFTGAPTTLDAGPVSLLLTNESAGGEFHVALLARAKDPAMTVEQFVATPFEGLMEVVDLVPGGAAAAPGQTSGMLADLEPGTYFLLCPVGDEGQVPHHLQGMITQLTVA